MEAFVPVTEFELNEETQEYEETVELKPQRFPNIPMIAFVDDEFNVYFVDETENGGGIEVENDGGVEVIKSISLKDDKLPNCSKEKVFERNKRGL